MAYRTRRAPSRSGYRRGSRSTVSRRRAPVRRRGTSNSGGRTIRIVIEQPRAGSVVPNPVAQKIAAEPKKAKF